MTVTLNGGTLSHEPMATDGVPFITASQGATLVSMPPILVADQPSSIGQTVPSGTRPVILSSTCSGVKSEYRLVLCLMSLSGWIGRSIVVDRTLR